MSPLAAVSHRGRFPRTLIDLHTTVVNLSLSASSAILDFLSQIIVFTSKRIHVLWSTTFLDTIEYLIGARAFQYLTELAFTGGIAYIFVRLCVLNRGFPHKDLELLRNNRFFVETIERNIPHVLRWYRAIEGLNLKNRLLECRDAFRSSPSILGRTPTEAKRWHSEEIARGLWQYPPSPGKVRLHFFQSHHSGSHDPNVSQHPDVRIDLNFDSRHGINLQKARKMLGVEKLSVITDVSPYRTTFDPHDQDKLSPLAVYDLSKQLREPIRVFEPDPSRITKIKRKIHDIVFFSCYLIYTILRSWLGFTIQNRAYLAATYGDNFAAICTKMSRTVHPLNRRAREAAWLIAQLSTFLVLLPVVILARAAAFVQSSISFAAQRSLRLIITISVVVRNIFSSLSRLSLRELFVVIALSWITLADFLLFTSKNP